MDAYPITEFDGLVLSPCRNPKTNKYDGKWWKTIVALEYMVDGKYIKIPPGYITDLGSIPWYARWLISPSDESILAFILHDFIYGKGGPDMGRRDTDRVLRECSKAMGQDKLTVKITYVAVVIGGGSSFKSEYNKFTPVDVQLLTKIFEDNDYKVPVPLNQ